MRPWRYFRSPSVRGVWTGLACAVAAAAVARSPLAHGLDDWLLDGCFPARDRLRQLLGTAPPLPPVVVIGLDEEDFDALKKPAVFMSPELGRVVLHARKSGATAVGIDVMIPQSLSEAEPEFFRGKLGRPAAMGKAVRDAGHVVLPVSFPSGQTGRTARRPIDQWTIFRAEAGPDLRDFGSIDLTEDGDRFIRRSMVFTQDEHGLLYPSFPLALAAWAEDKPYRWDAATQTAWLGDDRIPLDDQLRMRINWVGPPGTVPKVNFRTVLADADANAPTESLRGKVVVVGATAKDIQDYHATPYSNSYADLLRTDLGTRMSGPEIHTHAVATLLTQSYITTPWWLHPWPLLALAGAGLGWMFARLGLAYGFALFVAHHFGWKAAAVVALTVADWRVDMVGMLTLGAFAYAAAFAVRWRVVRRVLAATKSQALAKAIEDDPGRLDLAGENRPVSVMFVDVRGFSAFSSGHRDEPQRIVAVLNAYYAAVVPGIEAEGGTVNLFIGDGMMILFNAPLDEPAHAAKAVRAARGLVRTVRAKAAEFEKLGFPGFRVGVGVNTGTCTVGAIGSPTRLDYTAIGDVVNAAARLESATKDAGVDILIGPETFRLLREQERADLGCRDEPRVMELKGVGKISAYPVDVD